MRHDSHRGSFWVDLPVLPQHPLYLGDKHVAVSPIGDSTRIAGTMEFSGNNLRLDRLPNVGNAYVATAHDMLGVTLAPTTASLLSEFITTGRKPEVLEPFGFGRARRSAP